MTVSTDRLIGEILVEHGVITPLELDEALQRQRLSGDMLGRVLVKMGLCDEQAIVEALGVQQGMERIELSKVKVQADILSRIPADVAKFYTAVPVRERDGTLVVAMADPLNIGFLDDLHQIAGMPVRAAISNQHDVAAFIKENYASGADSVHNTLRALVDRVGTAELSMAELGQQEIISDTENLVQLAQEPEVIKIVNLVLLEAVQKRASDVHFEVYEEDFRIRIRVDGILNEIVCPPKSLALAITSRVKIMCNMDISERRLPQDQRIEIKVGDSLVDIRVASLPTLFGENIVMRLLDRTAVRVELDRLGFEAPVLKRIQTVIRRPNGIFLVTGPTSSGKTTTLYSCVNELNAVGVKIITTEDPVELKIDRVIQVQVREDVGLTFSACLRSILRQDPDIVMVGEIRDLETAQIAVEASLTGHLVLSTLHTNSAPETVTRLLDMDLEPFLITASLSAVLAQRLVRVLCRHCRERYRPDEEEQDALGLPVEWRKDTKLRFFRPVGCAACDYSGYMGRVGLFELMVVDDKICDMILGRAMAHELRRHARREQGMRTLRESGIIKCAAGITSADEVMQHTDKYED